MIKVSVMYPNTPGARFNHEYYRDKSSGGDAIAITATVRREQKKNATVATVPSPG
jgi:hypothetical protein